MNKIFLVCPNCRTRLSFNEVPGYQDKIVECPICHFKAAANVYQSGAAAKGGQGGDAKETELPLSLQPKFDMGQIRVTTTNQHCPLKMGTNVIGRIAQSGKADIQITQDPYMSRQHLQIDVIKTAHGIEHRLIEINSKNIIVLNDKPIQRNDILVLKFGDKLTLGKTDIYLEETDEESTKVIL
jgi:hypothetical protein